MGPHDDRGSAIVSEADAQRGSARVARVTSASARGRRAVASGLLFGAGVAASLVDLFVFHLLLQWHHFYDLSTTAVALAADGVFHAVAWGMTVAGLFLLADARRRGAVHWGRWTGAVLAGLGGFQLLDAVVNHKLLGIHQVRYEVDLLPYDLAWIGSAVVVLAAGLVILWRTRRRA